MTFLLESKEKLKQIYAKYSIFLLTLSKFVLAMVVFKGINSSLNFVKELDSVFILLILSLICSIMPMNVTVIFGALLLIGQCYGVGIEVAGFAAVLILALVILYIRFSPKDAMILLLTPLAYRMGIPCVIPIGYGLTRTPSSAVSAGCGVIIYYFMEMVRVKAPVLQGADTEKLMQNIKLLLDGLMKNKEMLMSIIAFAIVLILVNIISRLSVDYSWQLAISVGAASYVVTMLAGGLFIDAKIPVLSLIIGTIGAALVAVILEFFLFNVDYTRTEHLQYEDDEYYYYVKAVPKMSIAEKDVTVKKIHEPAGTEEPVREPVILPEVSVKARAEEEPDATIQVLPNEAPGGTTQILPDMTPGGMTQVIPDVAAQESPVPIQEDLPIENVDYESKLEESLKDL